MSQGLPNIPEVSLDATPGRSAARDARRQEAAAVHEADADGAPA